MIIGESYNFKFSNLTMEYIYIYGVKPNEKTLLPTLSKIVKGPYLSRLTILPLPLSRYLLI